MLPALLGIVAFWKRMEYYPAMVRRTEDLTLYRARIDMQIANLQAKLRGPQNEGKWNPERKLARRQEALDRLFAAQSKPDYRAAERLTLRVSKSSMEIVQEPDFYPECKGCLALAEAKQRLAEYSGQEKHPRGRIYCTPLPDASNSEFGISLITLAAMHRSVFEEGHENTPKWFRPSWLNVVACPGKIEHNSLLSPNYPIVRK